MGPAEGRWGRPAGEMQLAYWSNQKPAAAEIWSPAAGFPSMDIFGSCYCYTPQQGYVPPQSIGVGGQQLAVQSYDSCAASPNSSPSSPTEAVIYMDNRQAMEISTAGNQQHVVDMQNEEMDDDDDSRVSSVLKEVEEAYEADIKMMKKKMHKYPAVLLEALNDASSYTVPRIVAIGPYHHHRDHLKQAEKVKHMAVIRCVRESGRSLQQICDAVFPAADDARRLYDKDEMARISSVDFRDMMLVDACFLVQYMVWYTDDSDRETDPSWRGFFYSHRKGIYRDVLLLENQLPWRVVETVMRFRPVPLQDFVALWRQKLFRQDRYFSSSKKKVLHHQNEKPSVLDASYEPAHLLGLLRHNIVASSSSYIAKLVHNVGKIESLSVSVSAVELAEIGITLTANETTTHIGLGKKGMFFAELSVAPLSLNNSRASRLVNMAALELCTTTSFIQADVEDSACCSYLLLLSMLVHREEDVHELRRKGILQGGGFNNKEALDFFTNLHSLPHGILYQNVMAQIASYRINRRMQTKVHAFFHKKKKTICTVFTTIVAVFSIFGTLVGILVKLKPVRAAP